MTSPNHVSPQEFSDQSGLSIASVRRYLRDGKLPFVQPGGPRGRVLIPTDALARLAIHGWGSPCPPNPDTSPAGERRSEGSSRRSGPGPAWRRGRDL
jgi:hypothetical protein